MLNHFVKDLLHSAFYKWHKESTSRSNSLASVVENQYSLSRKISLIFLKQSNLSVSYYMEKWRNQSQKARIIKKFTRKVFFQDSGILHQAFHRWYRCANEIRLMHAVVAPRIETPLCRLYFKRLEDAFYAIKEEWTLTKDNKKQYIQKILLNAQEKQRIYFVIWNRNTHQLKRLEACSKVIGLKDAILQTVHSNFMFILANSNENQQKHIALR